jgi:acetoacetyl-CoA reductase/3-oxoacyl-[acyl-carrier protein] reductase
VIPGYINTDELMERYHLDNQANLSKVLETITMGRLGTPEDIFKTVNFILHGSEYITGQNFFVNGGHFMY